MASPQTIQPSTTDAYLSASAPTNNFGTDSALRVGYVTASNKRSLLSFNFSAAVPAGAVITSAILSLYAGSYWAGRNIGCYRLLRTDWVESQATWGIYKTGSNWGTAGALNTSTDYDTTDGATSASLSAAGWQNWTVTAQIQTARDSVGGIAHFVLADTGTSNAAYQAYESKNSVQTTLRPKLYIEYTVPFITGINIGDVVKPIDWTGSKINIGGTWKAIAKVQVNIGDVWKDVYNP